MGEIVAAMATVHAPQLITRPPNEDQAQLDASIAAMRRLGKVLDETKPDALVIIGLDHLETFFLDATPTFAMVVGEWARAEYATVRRRLSIHQPLARTLLNGLVARGFDITYAQDALLGHAFASPFEYVHEGRDIPVVPMFVNVYLPPMPTPRRCAELDRALAAIIHARPERVAIMASGGMSHYPGTWKYYEPEYEFDRWAIQELEHGDVDELLALTPEELDEVGNTELLTWMVLLGAIGRRRGELISYQTTSHHGHAVMRFIPEPAGTPPPKTRARYGSFRFKGQGYEFYKYPEPSVYPLQNALRDLKEDAALRERFFRNMDAVIAEYGMTSEQAEALKQLETEPLVAVGSHPILALSAMLVIQQHRRRLQAAGGPASGETSGASG